MDAYGRGEVKKFKDCQEAKIHFLLALWRAIKSINPNDCKARWLEMFDKEDYLHDEVPVPVKRG